MLREPIAECKKVRTRRLLVPPFPSEKRAEKAYQEGPGTPFTTSFNHHKTTYQDTPGTRFEPKPTKNPYQDSPGTGGVGLLVGEGCPSTVTDCHRLGCFSPGNREGPSGVLFIDSGRRQT